MSISQNTPGTFICCLSLTDPYTFTLPCTHPPQFSLKSTLGSVKAGRGHASGTKHNMADLLQPLTAQKSGWERGEQDTRATVCFPSDC